MTANGANKPEFVRFVIIRIIRYFERLDTRYLKMLKKSIIPHLFPLPNGGEGERKEVKFWQPIYLL
jgi:hypothetical protein